MNFPHFFIDRPIFAGVISIVITLVGVIALSTLPIAQYPEIAPPTIQVTTNYPGANAKVVSETVATPIEQQVNGVENMLYMSSQSTSDGNMTLSITFKLGTNLDTAQVLVQNRVAIAIPVLPPDVQRIGVTTKKQSPDITMVVHLVSPDGSLDSLFTSNYALLQIRDELARVDGVGDINVFGAREYSMRLCLDRCHHVLRRQSTRRKLVRIRSRTCKSQLESSARRQCQRAQPHFSTRSVRKAASRTKNSSVILSLKLAPTDKSLACAISRGSSWRLATTQSTAGSVESRRPRLRFTNSQDQTRSRPPMRCERRWLSSNSVSRAASTTQSFTIRQFLFANRSAKCRKRCSKQSRLSFSSS